MKEKTMSFIIFGYRVVELSNYHFYINICDLFPISQTLLRFLIFEFLIKDLPLLEEKVSFLLIV